MNKQNLVVLVFDTEKEAINGSHKLHELAAHGDVKLGNTCMIRKKEDGTFENLKIEKNTRGEDAFIGFAIGTLATMFLGPFALLIGMVTGTAIGASMDSKKASIEESFMEKVKAKLGEGKIAIIANCMETNTMFLDDTMKDFNAQVFRSEYKEEK